MVTEFDNPLTFPSCRSYCLFCSSLPTHCIIVFFPFSSSLRYYIPLIVNHCENACIRIRSHTRPFTKKQGGNTLFYYCSIKFVKYTFSTSKFNFSSIFSTSSSDSFSLFSKFLKSSSVLELMKLTMISFI